MLLFRVSRSTAISARACSCRDLNIALELFQPPFGFLQVEQVPLGIDFRQQLIALHFQFRPANRVASLQQIHLVLVIADGEIGLRFLYLLVDLVHFELRLFQAGAPFRVVEFNDKILLMSERP